MGTPIPRISEAEAFLSSLSSDSLPDDECGSRVAPSRQRSRSPHGHHAYTDTTHATHPSSDGPEQTVLPPVTPPRIDRFGTPECPREYDNSTRTYTMKWCRRYYTMAFDEAIGRYRPVLWENSLVATTADDVTELWTWKYLELPP